MRKYQRIFIHSAKEQLTYLSANLFSYVFFALVLFIFFSIWKVVYADKNVIAGYTIIQSLWYLSFSEAIELSRYRVLEDIQTEVKDGTVAYTLNRPYSYPLYQFSRAYGKSVVKLVPILIQGFILGTLLVGPLPNYWTALPFGILLFLLGSALSLGWLIIIGLFAFWMEESSPIYWIVQKLVFVLGGLFIPIDFFPPWLAGISKASPFAFSTYWPAKTMVDFSTESFFTALGGQIGYLALMILAIALVYQRASKKIEAQGG